MRSLPLLRLTCLSLSALLSGCAASTATLEARLPGNPVPVRDAVRHAGENLGYETMTGTMHTYINVGGGFSGQHRLEMTDADAFLQSRDSGFLADRTRANGAVRLRRDGDSTRIELQFGTGGGGDAPARARLFLEAVRQDLELTAGKRKPAVNERKSVPGFVARSFVTPFWGEHYLLADNPLAIGDTRWQQYVIPAIGEVGGWGYVAAGGLADSDRSRGQFLLSGILILCLYRGLMLFQIQDVRDYNVAASSPYDLLRVPF